MNERKVTLIHPCEINTSGQQYWKQIEFKGLKASTSYYFTRLIPTRHDREKSDSIAIYISERVENSVRKEKLAVKVELTFFLSFRLLFFLSTGHAERYLFNVYAKRGIIHGRGGGGCLPRKTALSPSFSHCGSISSMNTQTFSTHNESFLSATSRR